MNDPRRWRDDPELRSLGCDLTDEAAALRPPDLPALRAGILAATAPPPRRGWARCTGGVVGLALLGGALTAWWGLATPEGPRPPAVAAVADPVAAAQVERTAAIGEAYRPASDLAHARFSGVGLPAAAGGAVPASGATTAGAASASGRPAGAATLARAATTGGAARAAGRRDHGGGVLPAMSPDEGERVAAGAAEAFAAENAPTPATVDLRVPPAGLAASPGVASGDLAEQTEAFERAEAVLGAGDPAGATSAYAAYLARWPTGAFAVEARFGRLRAAAATRSPAAVVAASEGLLDDAALADRHAEIRALRAEALAQLGRCDEAHALAEGTDHATRGHVRRACR